MIKIYTDGSAAEIKGKKRELLGPPAYVGGWAFVVAAEGDTVAAWGWDPDTTIGRMELTACLRALQYASTKDKDVHLVTDAIYAQKPLATGSLWKWRDAGWVNSQGDVKNKDLWMELAEIIDGIKSAGGSVTVDHVKGHNGDRFNEIADGLAVNARTTRTSGSRGMGEKTLDEQGEETPAIISGGKMNIREVIEVLALEEGHKDVKSYPADGKLYYVTKTFLAHDAVAEVGSTGQYFRCSDGTVLGDPKVVFQPAPSSPATAAGLTDPIKLICAFDKDQVIDLFRSCMEAKFRLMLYGTPSVNGLGTDLCLGLSEVPASGRPPRIRTVYNLGVVEGLPCGILHVYDTPRIKLMYQALLDDMQVGLAMNAAGVAMLSCVGESGWVVTLGGNITVNTEVEVNKTVYLFDGAVSSPSGIHKIKVVSTGTETAEVTTAVSDPVKATAKTKTKAKAESAPAEPSTLPPTDPPATAVASTTSIPAVPPEMPQAQLAETPAGETTPAAVTPATATPTSAEAGQQEQTPIAGGLNLEHDGVLDILRQLTEYYGKTVEATPETVQQVEDRIKTLQKELKILQTVQASAQSQLSRMALSLSKTVKAGVKSMSEKDAQELKKLRDLFALLKSSI